MRREKLGCSYREGVRALTLEISLQSIITAGAAVGALGAILGLVFRGYDFCKKQQAQEKALEDIQRNHEEDMKAVKEEQTLIVYGVLACLKGLREQGCNGPVTRAIDKLEKHLNIEAHR